MRAWIPLVAVAAFALSGCTVGPNDAGAIGPDAAAFDEDSGSIEGRVLDSAALPIKDAHVSIDDGTETTTDSDGRFVFPFLDPGTYDVRVTATAFEPAVQRVPVSPGAPARVVFELESIRTDTPFVDVWTQSGFIQCSAGTRYPEPVPPYATTLGLCVAVDDRFRTVWSLPDLNGTSGFWFETTWQSTQAAGDGIETFWSIYQGTSSLGYIGNFEGGDPLSDPAPPPDVTAYFEEEEMTRADCGGPDACHLEGWHYVYANTLGSGYDADVGILFQQSYDDYVSLFHGAEESYPATYTALPDQ